VGVGIEDHPQIHRPLPRNGRPAVCWARSAAERTATRAFQPQVHPDDPRWIALPAQLGVTGDPRPFRPGVRVRAALSGTPLGPGRARVPLRPRPACVPLRPGRARVPLRPRPACIPCRPGRSRVPARPGLARVPDEPGPAAGLHGQSPHQLRSVSAQRPQIVAQGGPIQRPRVQIEAVRGARRGCGPARDPATRGGPCVTAGRAIIPLEHRQVRTADFHFFHKGSQSIPLPPGSSAARHDTPLHEGRDILQRRFGLGDQRGRQSGIDR